MKKADKQYWALSAIYRMTRINRWAREIPIRLLVERAKYKQRDAEAIASIWFRGPFRDWA